MAQSPATTGLSLEAKRELARKLLLQKAEAARSEFPLSLGQQALWFVYQLAPHSPAYNFVFAAKVRTELSLPALQAACQRVVQRHPALRTIYTSRDGQTRQRVQPPIEIDIRQVDASAWSAEEVLAEVRREADRPFDLRTGPLMRVSVLRCGGGGEDVLVMAAHHIGTDLWSMDILVTELREVYGAEAARSALELPPVSADFSDYVRWEQNFIASPAAAKLLDYWKSRLAGPLPVLNLPTDRPRPDVQTYRGDCHSWPLDEATSAAVRQLAKDHKATPFVTLLAVFQTLLHRYSGQEDIIVGTVTATRGKPEWERVVGYFLNQVPLRGDLSGNPAFSDFVSVLRDDVLGALEHQDYPFPLLVEKLQPARDPARTPIFQVMFIWDKPRAVPEGDAASAGLPLETILMEQRGAPFELTLIVFEIEGQLSLSFRYNSDVFDRSTIERMAGHFNTLLQAVIANPRQRLGELPLLTQAERHQILVQWNETRRPYEDQICFPELLQRVTERAPQAPAIIYQGKQLSYAQLNARANQLARRLQSLGVGPGQIVGICLPRCPELIISILATWKAGGAYVPLDPAYPKQRLAGMLEDARPKVLIIKSAMAGDLPGGDAHRLAIDSPDEVARLEQLAADNLPAQAQPDDLAYVIFTSGSTGRPKGTLLRHRGIMNLALENQVVYGFTPQDRILQFASSSFDASVYEFVQTLTAGAALVLADQQCMLPGAGLLEQLRKERVTAVCMPPSILAALPAQELPDLRIVTAAGEACPAEVVDRWAPGRRFFNAYGPTECTVWTTVEECFAGRGNPTIGRPLVNNQAYILNPHLEPQPVGVAGELYFASPGVAVGYLNRPELTAERFVPNPFSDAFDATLYRTGDLARYCSDGRIEFLGRIDHQVKLRGYRIELEEIEAALRQHVAIEQALVMARNDMGRDPQLVAYVVPKPGATSDAGELRDWLKDRLPAFMLPAAYLVLKEFPMTVNGKVDRAALPAPDSARRDLKQEYVAPRNPVEESLAQIVAEVLGLERVGIQDNFFDLGGASIQALRVVERATQAGYPLTPEMLFKHQTVCELAAAQQAEQQAAAKNAEAKQDTAATIPQQPAAMAAQPAEQTPRAAPAAHEPAAAPPANMVIESLGVYLPERVVSTDEVLQGCSRELAFPLERMTGIRSRRMVSEGEYSIDLARRAIEDCLRGSKYQPAEIDLLICCNISRCDGPDFAFSYEPTTALRLKHEFGFARAMAFDISNACAGFFTGLKIADSFLKAGVIRRAMVVSGEHITHLTRTAQWEIDGFMDPRLACLTLGDSGAAVIVETANQPGVGFHELELYTLGRYSNLCVAKLTDQPHGGATMFTDPVKASAVTIQQSVAHAQHVLARRQWNENNVHHVIMHQTSETTLDGAIQELNRSLGKEMCGRHNVIYNIAERGNTATTTHWVALMDQVLSRRIRSGQNIVFSTTGSGQTVGTALYTFDDLPERILAAREQRPHQGLRSGTGAPPQREPAGILSREPIGPRVRIAGVGTAWAGQTAAETMSLLQAAGEKCLANWGRDRSDVDLLIHAGVYRSEFVSEPALAAMAAGALGINDSIDSPQAKKTFALDLMDGAAGFLDACYVAEQMIRSGAHRHAMVMTSEIENNALARPDHLLGLEEGGAAVILEPSDDGSGLEAYLFKSFTLHLDAMESHTAMVDGIGALEISRRADLEDRYLECIAATVSELLTAQGLTADDLAVILPPQISKAFADRLANALQVPVEKVIDASGTGDAFTCSLARGWEKLRERGLPARGQRGLIISAGAGIQVGCALYRF